MHTHARSEPRARLCTRITLYTHHERRDRALVRVELSTSVELHSRARACIESTRIGIMQYAFRNKSQIYMCVSACRCIVRTNGDLDKLMGALQKLIKARQEAQNTTWNLCHSLSLGLMDKH